MSQEIKRVLVIEDDKGWQLQSKVLLNSKGYTIGLASNLEEALYEIDSRLYHVAIVDLKLNEEDPKNRDGMEVLKHIWELNEGTQALVRSGYVGETPLLNLLIEYKITVTDKNQEYVKQVDKGIASSSLLEDVEHAYTKANREAQRISARTVWEGSPFSFMTGVLARDVQIEMGGGTMSELREFLGELTGPYAPWLQARVAPTRIMMDNKCVGFQTICWSRELGSAIVIRFGRHDFFETSLKTSPVEKLLPFGTLGEKVFGAPDQYKHFTGMVLKLENAEFDKNFKRPVAKRTPEH